ncbi:PAS domain S-box protein [Geobacter pelophilus]|uniref:histidine kinase n=2 Tax=Geoanaerobacter pelophilus TaxID=60036 RepID=A0AAW4KZB1_9BACT|nr:PAS domain S-box protein [Geoanaerobacter pelophilus]
MTGSHCFAFGNAKTVRIGAFNYYPGIFQAQDGSVKGFYVDFLAEIARMEGWQIEYVYGNWAEGLARTKNGEVDLYPSVAWTEERAKYLDYGKVPLLTVWGELYVPEHSTIDSIKDMQGKKIGGMKGDFNAASFRNMVDKFGIRHQFVEFGNFEDVFKAVNSGLVDAGVANNTFGAAKQHEYNLKSSGIIFNPFDIFFATAKGKNREIIATLDKYLADWRNKSDSPFHQARERWSHGETASFHFQVPKWITTSLIVLVGFTGIATIFIILLRVQVRRKTEEITAQAAERAKIEQTLFFINESGMLHRGDELLKRITAYLAECLDVEYAFTGQMLPGKERVRTRGLFTTGSIAPDIEYDLKGTPCENVVGKKLCVYQNNVVKLFPDDLLLQEMQAEGYAATPLWDSQGNGIGLIGVVSRRPLGNKPFLETIIRIAATRASQELEAMSHLEVLKIINFTVENIRDAVYWILPDGRIWEINNSAAKMLGYTNEELLTKTALDINPGYSENNWHSYWEKIKADGNLQYETVHKTCDGREIPVEVAATFCSYDGREYICSIVRDITDRKHAEQQLIEYRQVIEYSQDMIFVIDRDYRYCLANSAFLQLRDKQLNQVIGHTAEEILGHDLFAKLKPYLDECFTGKPVNFEMQQQYAGKGLLTLDISYLPIADAGRAMRLAGVIRDQTEHRRLEEQLRQSQKIEAVGQLAGGIAHDFNNILTVIMGYSNMLLLDDKLAAEHRQEIEQIIDAAEKASRVTRGLLAFSRKQVMTPDIVNLNDIVTKVQVFLERIIGEDVKLQFVHHEAALNIYADNSQIEQVLMNLATNARDAMPKGGLLTIETSLQGIEPNAANPHEIDTAGSYACMAVSDTGDGMTKEICDRIFDPFFTTKATGKGTGLGMAIVHGIVKQHKGFINVYSELGRGTTFRIYLPIADKAPQQAVKPAVSEPPVRGSETILVAEDDTNVRNLVESLLKGYGYNVILAVDGQDCIEKFIANQSRIDLILLDMIMPIKTGKDAFEEIRSIRPDIKVLYTSGYTADFIRSRGDLEEDADLIMKPVQPSALLSKIREIIDRKKLQRQRS